MNEKAMQVLRKAKETATYFELSKRLNVPVSTIYRWMRTSRINAVYADRVVERLGR